MWLTNSSIGRKVIMSVTGLALILFLTFHACMNVVAIFSGEAYNMICEMLGANWYAVVATAGLGALVVLHFGFALLLTIQNRKARGASRYAVTDRPEKVSWASQNMLVLGIIICLGMVLHLKHFWANMMLVELTAPHGSMAAQYATDGYYWIQTIFACPIYVVLYLVWLTAIWFHMNHGFWSAFHTLGASGKTWLPRLKCIGLVYSTVIMGMYAAVVIYFYIASLCGGGACTTSSCCM